MSHAQPVIIEPTNSITEQEEHREAHVYQQLTSLLHLFPFSIPSESSIFDDLSITLLKTALLSKACPNTFNFYVNAVRQTVLEITLLQIWQESLDRYLAVLRSIREKEEQWQAEQKRDDIKVQQLRKEIQKAEVSAQIVRIERRFASATRIAATAA